MTKSTILLAATAVGAAAVCAPREARALGPVDLEVGARIGGGTNPFGDSNPNPLGFGVGARGGVSLMGFYGGLSFMYYLGSSGDFPTGSLSEKALLYGVEAGYGSTFLSALTLRWTLGVGNFQVNTSGAISGSAGNLYLEPGATLLISLGTIFVGADANVLVLPGIPDPSGTGGSSWQAAFTAHGQGGIKF